MASDATGTIPIMLDNFSAMKCFGKRAYDVYDKVFDWTNIHIIPVYEVSSKISLS